MLKNCEILFSAAELLKEAERLVDQKIHPQTIIAGWRKASDEAKKALLEASLDNSSNSEKFREDLMNIARTTLSSKILSQDKEHFAKLAVDAVLRLKGSGDLQVKYHLIFHFVYILSYRIIFPLHSNLIN